MKMNKKLMGVALGVALTLTGCGLLGDKAEDTTNEDDIENVQSFEIQKPEIHQVEDDFVDTENLQANLDKINSGERLDNYEPYYESELAEDIPDNLELNDSVYTPTKASDILEGTHLVYIGRDSCPFCQLLRVNLDPVVEHLENKLHYINTDDKSNEDVLIKELGLTSVPNISVIHEGEFVATFPSEYMYMKTGADFTSLANGIGDLTNIYLDYKYDLVDGEMATEDGESDDVELEDTEEGSDDVEAEESE